VATDGSVSLIPTSVLSASGQVVNCFAGALIGFLIGWWAFLRRDLQNP
jgi:hypothetical protein